MVVLFNTCTVVLKQQLGGLYCLPESSHVFPSGFKMLPIGHAHWLPAGDSRQRWLHPLLLWQAELPTKEPETTRF